MDQSDGRRQRSEERELPGPDGGHVERQDGREPARVFGDLGEREPGLALVVIGVRSRQQIALTRIPRVILDEQRDARGRARFRQRARDPAGVGHHRDLNTEDFLVVQGTPPVGDVRRRQERRCAVAEFDDARIVRYDHNRAPTFMSQTLQHFHHAASRVRVQGGRGLIGQDDGRIAG